ncbi:Aldo keto reductase [Pyrrhoderma noxium]|uniref:Aldo keto reductase n=1 Tax=Pyrrhoderma noxium TaxID=2282107 RepID=A0A286UHU8_9AGAM|nr:Aldo keto reductase [Pyrrhoderma noxium]
MVTSATALKISLGCMPFGEEGLEGVRVHSVNAVAEIVGIFQKHGHVELDTAYAYAGGTSEAFLGALEPSIEERGLRVSTKSLPGRNRTTPFEETFKATDELFKEGKFARLGISNYMSWEVAEIVMLCRSKNWVQPTIYQGIYNAIHRAVEPELFPCLRKFGLSFYSYNALGGGFFTGKYSSPNVLLDNGTLFDASAHGNQAQIYLKRYWNEEYFKALAVVRRALEQRRGSGKEKLTLTEAALRWISHHSAMKKEYGDCVIIGVSKAEYMEENLSGFEGGPLPEDVVKAIDKAWDTVRPVVKQYWI